MNGSLPAGYYGVDRRLARSRKRPLPPGGGGLSALAPQGAKRPRRLGREGEGGTGAACKPAPLPHSPTASPSPRFSNLATLVKRDGPPPPTGSGASLFHVVAPHP